MKWQLYGTGCFVVFSFGGHDSVGKVIFLKIITNIKREENASESWPNVTELL